MADRRRLGVLRRLLVGILGCRLPAVSTDAGDRRGAVDLLNVGC